MQIYFRTKCTHIIDKVQPAEFDEYFSKFRYILNVFRIENFVYIFPEPPTVLPTHTHNSLKQACLLPSAHNVTNSHISNINFACFL